VTVVGTVTVIGGGRLELEAGAVPEDAVIDEVGTREVLFEVVSGETGEVPELVGVKP